MAKHKLYLSLGTNLGDKEKNLLTAIDKINKSVGTIVRQSTFICTEPVGFVSENSFLNAAVLVETDKQPLECLEITQQIEREMGRTKKSHDGIHYDRPIDIDILLFNDISLDLPELKIPHPRMYERDFVMIPLKEIL